MSCPGYCQPERVYRHQEIAMHTYIVQLQIRLPAETQSFRLELFGIV
jgi:hypothetical protein